MRAWVDDQIEIYFRNAGVTRDFRSWLRGKNARYLLMAYLGLLILISLLAYYAAAGGRDRSFVEAQTGMTVFTLSFVYTIMALVLLTAPALVASSVIVEYDRQSIDLLQSAPIPPKYFVIGRLLAAARAVFLLLILTLPVATLGVLLGGRTWWEVAEAFYAIFLQAMILMALAIPFALALKKVVNVLGQVFSTAVLLSMLTVIFGSTGLFSRGPMAMSGGGPTNLAPLMLSPAGFPLAIGGQTQIGPMALPNWVVATVIALVLVRWFLLMGGAYMAPAQSKDVIGLRIYSLILLALFAAACGAALALIPMAPDAFLNTYSLLMASLLLLPLNYLLGWTYLGEKKYTVNGFWAIRNTFSGTPNGSLPYIALMTVVALGAFWGAVFAVRPTPMPMDFVLQFAFPLALLTFMIGLAWLASAVNKTTHEQARRTFGAFALVIFAVVMVGFTLVGTVTQNEQVLRYVPFFAGFQSQPEPAMISFPLLVGLGVGFFIFGERIRRKRIAASYETPPAPPATPPGSVPPVTPPPVGA